MRIRNNTLLKIHKAKCARFTVHSVIKIFKIHVAIKPGIKSLRNGRFRTIYDSNLLIEFFEEGHEILIIHQQKMALPLGKGHSALHGK